MADGIRIGELAERCEVSRDTLRFYEREGLLSPPRRTSSGYRAYTEDDASRVVFIREAQSLGLTLDDIRELIRLETLHTPEECERVAQLLRERIQTLDKRLADMRALRRRLASSLERCTEKRGDCCPVVAELSTASGRARKGTT
jgi:MerR family Zn(II)-responsive transcriptional regulator of zntA